MKTVITYGTYDLFHYGHLLLLKRAKELGDFLIVALSTDEFNLIKKKKSYFDYETRKEMLSQIKYVDLIIPEETWEQKRNDILKYKVNTFVMGDDWKEKFDNLNDLCSVVYLPRTKYVSSTDLRAIIEE